MRPKGRPGRAWQLAAISFAAFVLSACGGQPGEAPPPAEAPAPSSEPAPERVDLPPLGEPALWTLADEDTTIHMFGTIHLLKPGTEWRTEALDTALEDADAIFFEADVTSAEAQATAAQLVPRLGVFTDGRKLSDLLDEDEEREVREALELVDMPMSAMEPLRPWFAGLQLSVMALQDQGYEPQSGVEMELGAWARETGTPTRYLESMEQQLRFFADLPEDDQVDLLVSSAIQIEDDPGLLDRLVEDWAEGDLDDIADMLAEPDALGSEGVYDVLIVERNRNWVDQIETLLDDEAGTFLLAVGAAHLVGEDSVVEMLRAEGFEVSGP